MGEESWESCCERTKAAWESKAEHLARGRVKRWESYCERTEAARERKAEHLARWQAKNGREIPEPELLWWELQHLIDIHEEWLRNTTRGDEIPLLGKLKRLLELTPDREPELRRGEQLKNSGWNDNRTGRPLASWIDPNLPHYFNLK